MSEVVKILKASGKLESFNPHKVLSSLKRAGSTDQEAVEILQRVETRLYPGIPSQEIYHYVFQFLNDRQSPVASRYNLKKAIMDLGPSGYPFEKFVAGFLRHLGYQTQVNQIIKGQCVSHEVDVVAQKNRQKLMVECKFHNRPGLKVVTQTALYTYARFLDLKKYFSQGWLITNTKITSQVQAYANCVNLKITTWDYPKEESLSGLISQKHLYPITCLNSLTNFEKEELLRRNLVFCHEISTTSKLPISKNKLDLVKNEAEKITNNNFKYQSSNDQSSFKSKCQKGL